MALSLKARWLLIIIGSTKYIEGATRLQKYGLLVEKRVSNLQEFYHDWISHKYGVFSKSLATDLEELSNQGYVSVNHIINSYGKEVPRYEISNSGRNEIQDLVQEKKDEVKMICEITQYYFSKPMKELLADVYTLYPEFTGNSEIIHDVGKKKVELHSFLSPEFELPFEEGVKLDSDVSNLLTKTTNEHVFNDEDMREKLSKMIGLKEVPRLDSRSFDRFSGILQNKIKSAKIDSEELVGTVRGS